MQISLVKKKSFGKWASLLKQGLKKFSFGLPAFLTWTIDNKRNELIAFIVGVQFMRMNQ